MTYVFDELSSKVRELEKNRAVSLYEQWKSIIKNRGYPATPLKVEISLTKNCNQNCFHCSNEGNKNKGYFKLDYLDEILKMQPAYIVLTGGEPFLHSNLSEIVKKAKCNGAILRICSNGTLLQRLYDNPSLYNLLDDLDIIQISFDAADSITYKKIRRANNYDIVINNIKNLKKKSNWLKVDLHCVPTPINIKQLNKIYDVACQLDVDFFSIAPLAPLGNAAEIPSVSIESLLKTHITLLEKSQELKHTKYLGRPYEICTLYGLITSTNHNNEMCYSCSAGHDSLYIECDGNIYPCVYMQDERFCLGNVENGLEVIIESLKKRIPRSFSLKGTPCEDCYLWGDCTGGCIGLSYWNIGSYVPGWDPRCAKNHRKRMITCSEDNLNNILETVDKGQ
jgi:radical SAM protein with 4Fe4S-binding SPASM domain